MKARISIISALAILSCMLVGCAYPKALQYVRLPDQTSEVEDPTKCRIYVIGQAVIGAGVLMDLTENGKRIGQVNPSSYLCWERPPGLTTLVSYVYWPTYRPQDTNTLDLQVKAGEVRYVFLSMKRTMWTPRTKMELINKEQAEQVLRERTPSLPARL